MGEPPCEQFIFMNTSILFCDESFCSGKLVPSVPYFYLSIILFFILSFLHLLIRPVGYNLKSSGVAREAQLLVTIGRGGVRSVGIFKAKLRKVIKGIDYPFIRVERYLPYDSKKREVVLHPRGAPEQPRLKVFGSGRFIGANIK